MKHVTHQNVMWGITYHTRDFNLSSWAGESAIVRINVDAYPGNATCIFPEIEYLKNSKYCQKDKDCAIHISGCVCSNSLWRNYVKPGVMEEACNSKGLNCKCINNTCTAGKLKRITLSITARGDFVDPGPIADECLKKMAYYANGSDFKDNGFSGCTLVESEVGWSDKGCPNGYSPEGCSICVIECR